MISLVVIVLGKKEPLEDNHDDHGDNGVIHEYFHDNRGDGEVILEDHHDDNCDEEVILEVACSAGEILKITLNSFPVKAAPLAGKQPCTTNSDHKNISSSKT